MASIKDSLPTDWTQTSPSTYERSMDSMDFFYHAMAGAGQGRPEKDHWLFTAAIRIDTDRPGLVDDVKAAWIALRYKFPGFSSVIKDGRWIYRVADKAELASWLEESFHVHDTEKTTRQLYPFETNAIKRGVLRVLPRTQEIVLQCPHAHMDGIGSLIFFNNLLNYLVAPLPAAEPAFGTEGANLVPPSSITTRVQPCTSGQKDAWDAIFHNFLASFPTVRLNTENKGAPAGRTTNVWLTFDPADTGRIVARARELGVTVTSVLQAAVSLSARQHGQVSNKTHATMAIYNARPYIDSTEFPHERLVNCNTFGMPAVYPLVPESFVETAKKAGEVLQSFKKGGLLVAATPLFATGMVAALSAPVPENMPVAADLQLSSLGVVDKHMRSLYRHEGPQARADVAVRDFWLSLDLLGPGVAAEAWTFNEKLSIELVYNEAYHQEESMVSLLRFIHEQLTKGLNLDLKFDAREPGNEE
ncbi:uncharacterized protein DNG_04619 [Cephalotrichum gorgonifer]|uniref:Condensation domain-containing protein n=1 Tax=Cephalotrichum gorgonifer TaxID=2041049 RepID=A0AAE8MWF6_9PEZI|nr:uncharacterized protein DNG_04619 [Cephalotrichum gorgonifer]